MNAETARVAYVTMRFPQVPETFAGTDIRALRSLGWEISVHALRHAPDDAVARARQWQVEDVPRTDNSLAASWRGILLMARWPLATLDLMIFVARHTALRPAHLVRSLLLMPRAFDIVRELRRLRPHVIHAFWGHYPALVLRLAERLLPDAVRSTFLGAYDLTMEYGGSGPVARRSHVVWTHAEANRAEILEMGVSAERLEVVHRGIELHRLPATGDRRRREERIVAVGRMIPEKRFERVLEVFSRVRDLRPEAALDLIGDGPSRPALERQVRQAGLTRAVTFHGMLPHADVLRAMAEARVLLVLSTKEGERLPNVVKEALGCGTPVVASRTPGIDELLRDERFGRIIDPGDIESAVTATLALMTPAAPERSQDGAEAARRLIEEHFDSRKQMARYAARWRALIASPGMA